MGGNGIGKTNVKDFWSFVIKKWLGFIKDRAKIGKKHMEKDHERRERTAGDGGSSWSTRTS